MKIKNKKVNKDIMVIDGENATAGRLASYSAKQALLGNEIAIINAEKAVVTGREKEIKEKYLKLRQKGGSAIKGPFFPSQPERILKRMIRGMLPYKRTRGREAFKRIKCYKGLPKEFENMKKIKSGKQKSKAISLNKISIGIKQGRR